MDILPFGDASMKLKFIFLSENLLDHRLKCENFKNEKKKKKKKGRSPASFWSYMYQFLNIINIMMIHFFKTQFKYLTFYFSKTNL